jgi:hypothetical protein
MTLVHIAHVVLKYTGRSIIDLALERYASHLVKTSYGYLVYQVDALLTDNKVIPDSYAARTLGYYTLDEVIKKIESGKSDISKQIVSYSFSLHEDDDFILVDDVDNVINNV